MLYSLLLLNLVCTVIPLLSIKKEIGLKISITVLFIFLALRYNFGNDYMAYYMSFNDMTFEDRANTDVEIGYNLLCCAFRPLGFFTMIFCWSIFYCFSLYYAIRRYVEPQYYWLVMLCLISNADLVFFGASAVRQTLAFSCILIAIPFLEKKNWLLYCVLVLLASTFHQSSIVFLFLYPLMYLDLQNKKFILFFGLVAIGLMTVFKGQFESVIQVITMSNFEKYAERYGDSEATLGGGIAGTVVRVVFMLLFLWCMRKEEDKIKSIFYILSVLCIVIFTFRNQVMLQRYTMYFGYMMSFAFAYVLKYVKGQKNSLMYFAVLFLTLFWNINMAFSFALQSKSLFEYHTIFEVL